jgi:BirA family biotin operon repressor/biotin-[acetyl-CoA-carboxylase] ligase
VSIVLRPPLAPAAAPMMTLMAAVAAHQALSTTTGLAVDIRWPNDLLVNGKKVCGILTEMNAEVDRLHAVVIGIGINVNHQEMPGELKDIATSLSIEGRKNYSRTHLLVTLLKELERKYHLLLDEGGATIARQWTAASTFAQGKQVRVRLKAEEFLATTAGLEPSGALRIRREDGREEVMVSGEIVEVK